MHRSPRRSGGPPATLPSVPPVTDWATLRTDTATDAPFDAALGRLRSAREPGGDADVGVAPLPDPLDPGDNAGATTGSDALADDLRSRLADRREAGAAARYSAAAYAALQGHVPGGSDEELQATAGGRRRWALAPRTALVAVAVVLLLGTGLAVVQMWSSGGKGQLTSLAQVESAGSGAADSGAVEHGASGFGGGDPEAAANASAPPSPEASPGVVVDVVGQVNAPGLLTLPDGSRVADAVTAAGGATAGAELSAVNLARLLVDGEQLRIPAPGEVVAPAPAAVTGAGPAGVSADGLVNLNTADSATLETLPGVGPALAGRILDWRESNGAFASVDELDEVTGIGPAMLAKLRDLVTV